MTTSPDDAVGARRRPGRKWYVVAALLALAGLVGAALSLWQTVTSVGDDLQRGSFPGEMTLTLPDPGTYTIFVEYPATTGLDPDVAEMRVGVLTEQGQPVALTSPNGTFTYTLGDRSGEALFQFEVAEAGAFLLAGGYPDDAGEPTVTLAVGRGVGGRLLAGIGAAILLPLVTWSAAIAIVVVTFLRRRKAAASVPGTA